MIPLSDSARSCFKKTDEWVVDRHDVLVDPHRIRQLAQALDQRLRLIARVDHLDKRCDVGADAEDDVAR